jgi:hypothetical protein
MALKEAFIDLFGIVCAKDAFVTSHLELSGGSSSGMPALLERLMIGK